MVAVHAAIGAVGCERADLGIIRFLRLRVEIAQDFLEIRCSPNAGETSHDARSVQRISDELIFCQRMKDQGLCKKTGISFHGTPDLLEDLLKHYPQIDLVQLQLNYADWNDAGVQSHRCYDICMAHGKAVLVMEPVKGGNLTNLPEEAAALLMGAHSDWSQASWAIRFAASLPGVYRVLSGMSSLEQMEDNTGYMQDFTPLTDEETALCAKAAAIIKSNTAISCTGCRYCEGDCPQNIAISNYFSLYNEEKRSSVNYVHASGFYYKALSQTRGKATDCIECGLCEKNCPQNLPIRENLKKVAEMFEKK